MNQQTRQKPVILVFSAHDPSGAAGVQADIESIAATGGHSMSVTTGTSAQNTAEFIQLFPQAPAPFLQQTQLLLSDMDFQACKIGLIGSIDLLEIIANTLSQYQQLPVVLDPVLAAGVGTELTGRTLQKKMIEKLLPLATVITPNRQEAYALTETQKVETAAKKLMDYGCQNVLITGADEDTEEVENVLYRQDDHPLKFHWERLPNQYHGSGCTLSAALASYLGQKMDIVSASEHAQRFTWEVLKNGSLLGKGQHHPDRFYSVTRK